jgi:Tfp pilus assembly protein PilF
MLQPRPPLLFLLLLLLITPCLFAQGRRPGPGSTNSTNNAPRVTGPSNVSRVEVQVTTDDAHPLQMQALVELSGVSGGVLQQSYTDMEGRVSFSVTSGQMYQLKISGPGVETTQASFEVLQGENFHHQSVSVKLSATAGTNNAPGGMISASMLNVPVKARREFDKGAELMQAQKWADAKQHFEKAIETYPNFDWAYNNIGVIDMRLKDEPGAREAFSRAVAINNRNPDATRNLARLKLQDSDYEAAKALLQQSLTALPGDPTSLTLLAFAQFKTKQFDEALANAERAHRGEPDPNPLAHLIAAAVLESKGDRAGAEKQYQTYLKEAPDTPQAQIAREGLLRVQAQAKN